MKKKKVEEKYGKPKAQDGEKEKETVTNGVEENEASENQEHQENEIVEEAENHENEANEDEVDEEGEDVHENSASRAVFDPSAEDWNKTLSPAYIPKFGECSVESCLGAFCSKEELSETNKFGCTKCFEKLTPDERLKVKTANKKKVYTNATKQFLIHENPKVLTVHLKRFEQRGFSMVRLNRTVSFGPSLNLSPFCAESCTSKPQELFYDLYAVVVHSGTMNSGHYTAYVKATMPNKQRRWFYISDSSVSPVRENQVYSCAGAYILFYEKRL